MQRHRAFTLIELLVVVSIVALLVSFLLPALGQARTVALDLKCKAVERGMMVASVAYAADEKQFLPHGDNSPWYLDASSPNGIWYETSVDIYAPAVYPSLGQFNTLAGPGQLMYNNYLAEQKEAIGCPQTDFRESTPYCNPSIYTGLNITNFSSPVYPSTAGFAAIFTINPGSSTYAYRTASYTTPLRGTYAIRGPMVKIDNMHQDPTNPTTYYASPMAVPEKTAFFMDFEQCSQTLHTLTPAGQSPVRFGWARTHKQGFMVGYLDGHVNLFEDPARTIMYGSNYAWAYGSGWAMNLMDVK